MQKWWVGVNTIHKTCGVFLDEGPWWVWWLQDVSWWVCDHIPQWRIPFLNRIHIVRDGEDYTFAEWNGGTIHTLWHSFIDMPLTDWCCKHIETKRIPMEWDACKSMFYDDHPGLWDEED